MKLCTNCSIRKREISKNGYKYTYCRICNSRLAVLRQKKVNYKYEKTPEQRIIRNIKRQTRYYFPLLGHNCEFCGKKATEHHHNTKPIEFDKFNYICHSCHNEIAKRRS
jgi:hypothetical protein